MGVFVGNFLGLITVLIAVGVGYPSLVIATQVFLGITYSLWLIFLGIDLATRPKTDLPFCRSLEQEEQRTYRRYHVAIDFPVAGHVYSGWLNFLRVAGLVFAGLCAWKGLYVLAGAAFLLFLLTAGLIHRNNPWYYLGRQAVQGHARAGVEMALIERVFTLRHAGRQSVQNREQP
ncbi:hypothetical protein [Methylotetracoccus oryzae]|uniref:hypothetical protein n=1 Tax=Methylotetracoccus oryzae TaxID=1919059 RepID=UPI001117E39F|nr:hypothetical protein [Methylotetracoccus oryzae]